GEVRGEGRGESVNDRPKRRDSIRNSRAVHFANLLLCVTRGRYFPRSNMKAWRIILIALILSAGFCLGQFRSRRDFSPPFSDSGHYVRIEGGLIVNEDEIRTARETDSHSSGTPNWTNAAGFEEDVFTFTRIIFYSAP